MVKAFRDLLKISTKLTYVMTPALKPKADARTLREANFTSDGKKTTAAPNAVAKPAAATSANATPTFGLFTVIFGDVF